MDRDERLGLQAAIAAYVLWGFLTIYWKELAEFVSQWQARAFIGSDWKIPTEFADAFARRALDRLLGCDPGAPPLALGAALHATAAEVLELKNPFPLIYALYGRPELQAS